MIPSTVAQIANEATTFAKVELEFWKAELQTIDGNVSKCDIDPVFEGLVKHYRTYIQTLEGALLAAADFEELLEKACSGVRNLAESLVVHTAKSSSSEPEIAADACKFKEASTQIAQTDAPFSVIAKLKRDLAYNVLGPLNRHIYHAQHLERRLQGRARLLAELKVARNNLQSHLEGGRRASRDPVTAQLKSEVRRCEVAFERENSSLLEWLLILEAYSGDINDSLLQTIKYLQYEFYTGCAHTLARVLPKAMEFRPLMEMTPEYLEPQVKVALSQRREGKSKKTLQVGAEATSRILSTVMDEEPEEKKEIAVDALALSLLTAQGFPENLVRQTLKKCDNNMQQCLDILTLDQPAEKEDAAEPEVRLPTTVKLMEKLKAWNQAQVKKEQRRRRVRSVSPPDEDSASDDSRRRQPPASEKDEDKNPQTFEPLPLPKPLSEIINGPVPVPPGPLDESPPRRPSAAHALRTSLLDEPSLTSSSSDESM